MNKLKSLKNPLFRAFTDEQYASDFLNGKFRLRLLSQYRNIEDHSRKDGTEGYGHFIDKLDSHWHTEFAGPIYVLCFAKPEVDSVYLKEKMGNFIVKIERPTMLALDIEEYLTVCNIRTFNGVHGRPVAYTKGQKYDQNTAQLTRAELSVTQKPAAYRHECEYRFYIILNQQPSEPVAEFLNIDLSRRLSYAAME